MVLVIWGLAGAGAGIAANILAREYGAVEDVIVGIVGAIVFGWAFALLAGTPVTTVDPLDVASSLVGATTLILVSRGITRSRSPI